MVEGSAREALKEQLKQSPSFKARSGGQQQQGPHMHGTTPRMRLTCDAPPMWRHHARRAARQAELKDRIKTALLGKVPASAPIQYNFDS